MDKLIALKTVIERVYVAINSDGRKEIIIPMGSMFHKPLVVFDVAYKNFIETVAANADTYDRWMNIQIQVFTELQDDQEAIPQFAEIFKKVLKGTEGAEMVVFDETRFQDTSFIVALAFRVYLDAINIQDVVMPRHAVAPAKDGEQ